MGREAEAAELYSTRSQIAFLESAKIDAFIKTREFLEDVIPAKAGIHGFQYVLDAGSSPA